MTLSDRAKAALEAFIRAVVSKYDYAATYACTVVLQHEDGTLDLRPEDLESIRLPPRVPIAYGIPGVRATVKPGSRVSVTFEDLDPSRPIATLWDASAITELALDTDAATPRPLARMGDVVEIIMPPTMPVTGTITTTGAPIPFAGVLVVPDAALGVITIGTPKVLA